MPPAFFMLVRAAIVSAVGVAVAELGDAPKALALLGIGDELKPEAAQAVAELARRSVESVMVSGDSRVVAEAIAARVGIANVRAEVLPQHLAAHLVHLHEAHAEAHAYSIDPPYGSGGI